MGEERSSGAAGNGISIPLKYGHADNAAARGRRPLPPAAHSLRTSSLVTTIIDTSYDGTCFLPRFSILTCLIVDYVEFRTNSHANH
jgi:hypothetical protein